MKSWRRALPLLANWLLIFFLAALPALAAEGAEEDPAASTAGLIFRWLNFILVFGGIGYLIAKHGGAFFRANAKAIAASITEATAAKAEADRELREVETKIARLDKEITDLREAARRNQRLARGQRPVPGTRAGSRTNESNAFVFRVCPQVFGQVK